MAIAAPFKTDYICEQCGSLFCDHTVSHRRFCCHQCYAKYLTKHPPVKCERCGKEFHRNSNMNRARFCSRTCWKTGTKSKYKDIPEQQRAWHLKAHYGISLAEYQAILVLQGGGCAVCGKKKHSVKALHVDHDHKTGKTRGIVCSSCNRAIAFMGDSPELAKKLVNYLEVYSGYSCK